jgi:hypothetical protein
MAINLTAETYKFIIRKREVEDKTKDILKKILHDTAEVGHVLPSGTLNEAISDFNILKRIAITEKDVELVKEQLEQELTELDLAYRQQISTAQWSLEQEEQQLLADLEEEIAGLENFYDMAEQDLAYTLLQVEERQVAVNNAITAFGIEKVQLERQMMDQDVLVMPYQTQLINARILVIVKKLEMLPYLQSIIDKERELLIYMATTMGYEQQLVEAKKQLQSAQQPLLSMMYDLASKKIEYAYAHRVETNVLIDAAIFDKTKVDADSKRTDAVINVMKNEYLSDQVKKRVARIKNSTELRRLTDAKDLLFNKIQTDMSIANENMSVDRQVLSQKDLIHSTRNESGLTNEQLLSGLRMVIAESLTDSAIDVSRFDAQEYARHLFERIKIMSQAELTSTFNHYVES